MTMLAVYAVVVTIALLWVAVELKAERAASRMVDEFRENDRKFYRGWEDIWFKQLEKMSGNAQPKKPATQIKKSKTQRTTGRKVE